MRLRVRYLIIFMDSEDIYHLFLIFGLPNEYSGSGGYNGLAAKVSGQQHCERGLKIYICVCVVAIYPLVWYILSTTYHTVRAIGNGYLKCTSVLHNTRGVATPSLPFCVKSLVGHHGRVDLTANTAF